ELIIPADIKKTFKKTGLLSYFESTPYSHRKEYIRYIDDAKKKETRINRITKAVSKLEARKKEEAFKVIAMTNPAPRPRASGSKNPPLRLRAPEIKKRKK